MPANVIPLGLLSPQEFSRSVVAEELGKAPMSLLVYSESATNIYLFQEIKYRKILIISPGLIIVQKAAFLGLFLESLFSEGFIIERNFAFQNGLGLTIKTA